MQIKDIIAQVRAKLSSEESEKVNSLLSDAVRVESELLADRSAANNESKARKEKIRELEAIIEDNKTALEAATQKAADIEKEKTELIKYKEQWENQKAERETANKAKWETTKAKFDVKETDKSFESISKIKKFYALDDELTPEQIENNLKLATQHEELGLFTAITPPPPTTPRGATTDSGTKILNPYDNS